MEILKLIIVSSNLDQIVNYLVDHLPFDYENHSAEMSVLAQEEYHLRSTSTQLNMIVAKRKGDSILLDVIGGAGGSGLLNCDFGTEKGYLKKVSEVLECYGDEFGISVLELENE